jgi:hypothetical protein
MFKSAALSAFSLFYTLEQCAGCMLNKSEPNVIAIQKCIFMSFVLETNVHLVYALMTKRAGVA